MKISATVFRVNPLRRKIWFRKLTTDSVKPFKDVPGLNALPVIGTIHHFLPIIGSVGLQRNTSDIFSVLNKKFGPIVKWEGMFGRETTVIFFEPKDYEKVHRAEESNPMRPGLQALKYYREVLHKEKYGDVYGLSTVQGEQWREFRTKVNPAMLKVNVGHLYTPEFEKIAQDSISRLLKMNTEALSDHFISEIDKWALETISLVALGSRVGCLEDHNEDHPSQKLMFCAKTIPEIAFKLEFSPAVWKKDKSGTADFKTLLDVFDTQFGITESFIKQAKNKIQNRSHDIPDEDRNVLEKLLALDDKVAIIMANEMLLAGVDTMAFTLTGLLYQLAVHQDIQDKVREEFRQQKGSKYFKACLKESLRVSSVVPSNVRLTSKEHIVGGYQIPKGVFAVVPNEMLSKSEDHYLRANDFLPERWIVDKSNPLYHGNTHPMVTLPFGFGVRACIGRRIAELEVEVFVKKLLESVKLTWTGPPIQTTTKLLNTYVKPFSFKLESLN